MFDKNLVLSILKQVDNAVETIKSRAAMIRSVKDFTDSRLEWKRWIVFVCSLWPSAML